jgi:hypothetical protein
VVGSYARERVAALIATGGATCSITRESGRGANVTSTTQTGVPYWRDDPTRARLAALAGGAQNVDAETLYFQADADVQAKDVLTDGPLRWTVDGVGEMTPGAVLTVYATRRSN